MAVLSILKVLKFSFRFTMSNFKSIYQIDKNFGCYGDAFTIAIKRVSYIWSKRIWWVVLILNIFIENIGMVPDEKFDNYIVRSHYPWLPWRLSVFSFKNCTLIYWGAYESPSIWHWERIFLYFNFNLYWYIFFMGIFNISWLLNLQKWFLRMCNVRTIS